MLSAERLEVLWRQAEVVGPEGIGDCLGIGSVEAGVEEVKGGKAMDHAAEVIDFGKGETAAGAVAVVPVAQPFLDHRVAAELVAPDVRGHVLEVDRIVEP